MNTNILELLDGFSKQSRILVVDSEKLVLKEYGGEAGLIKWLVVNLSSTPVKMYPFVFNPRSRMEREVSFLRTDTPGFMKPGLRVVDYIGVRIIRDYVEGEEVDSSTSPQVFRVLGRSLGMLHCSGWALGDTKVSNFVSNDGRVYIVDAEQAVETWRKEHFSWDLVVFASTLGISCYSSCVTNQRAYLERIEAFLQGYLENPCAPVREAVYSLTEGDSRLLLFLLVPFPLNMGVSRLLKGMQGLTHRDESIPTWSPR